MDRFGLLPPAIRANYEREEMVERHLAQGSALAEVLKEDDPRLSVVFFGDRADPKMGIVPGRWHVRRENDADADSYFPITGPTGEYREPDFGVVEELRQRDMWKRGIPDPTPDTEPERDQAHEAENAAYEIRNALRVPGDGGLAKRRWAR